MHNIEFKTGVIRPIEVFKEAWAMIKNDYWMVLAVVFVGIVVAGAVPLVLVGPMMCGIYLVMLQKMEGKPVDFAQLFKGLDFFLQSLILTVIIMVPFFILLIVFYVPIIAMTLAGQRMNDSEVTAFLIGVLAVEFVFVLLMVCVHTLLLFAYPLMADKKLKATDAIKLSIRAAWKNLGGVAGMMGVACIVSFIGVLMLCVGIYLVMPLIMAATTVAYRKIFPAEI